MLSEPQIQRYSRHILLREVGGTGQQRLLNASIGLPRLDAGGRACALWLARAGVGALALPEDRSPAPLVDQAGLLMAADAGLPLVDAVKQRLRFHAPDVVFTDASDDRTEPGATTAEGAQAAVDIVRTILLSKPGGTR